MSQKMDPVPADEIPVAVAEETVLSQPASQSQPRSQSQSQSQSQEQVFSMSRPEDEDNEDVYPRPRSPTGLSGTFPKCKVTGDPIEPEKEKPKDRDLLSDVLRDVAENDLLEDLPGEAPQRADTFQSEGSLLEDAQRLEPSLDPQSMPIYHELQPSASLGERSIVLDASDTGDVKVIRCIDVSRSSTSSDRRVKTMEELGEDYYYPPNQLAAGSASAMDPGLGANTDQRPHKRFRPGEGVNRTFSLSGATAVDPPPGPLAVRLTSAVGRVDYSPVFDLTKNGESGFIPHDFPWEGPDVNVPDPTLEELGERFFLVREMISNGIFRAVPKDNMVSFLMVVKDEEGQIYIPSGSFFDRVVNLMEVEVLTKLTSLRSLSWSTSKQYGCGFLELSSIPTMEAWRAALSDLDLDAPLKVDTFPRDCLLLGPDVTVLLKEAHLEYNIKWMGRSVVGRNTPLKGNVRVVCSKQYHAHDITRHAVNMNGWQMVYLAGDCVFMEYLSRCPVSLRFHVGPGSVVLRGGIRKPTFLTDQARAQFTWVRPGASLVPSMSLNPVQSLAPAASTQSSSSSLSSASVSVLSSKKVAGKGPKRRPRAIQPKPTHPEADQPLAASSSASAAPIVLDTPPPTLPPLANTKTSKSGTLTKSLSSPPEVIVVEDAEKNAVKPKNRSARLKARTAKIKGCC